MNEPMSIREQRQKLEEARSRLGEVYSPLCCHVWEPFFGVNDGILLAPAYDDLQFRDAPALCQIASVLPYAPVARLVVDERDARFSHNVVALARPDLFKSERAHALLARAHRWRRLFMLGRYAFFDIADGRCYWRVEQKSHMTEYGVVARCRLETTHYVVMIAGLSWIGTWAAAKAATELRHLLQIEELLAPQIEGGPAEHRGALPIEVLIEVKYDVAGEVEGYVRSFNDRSIVKLIEGRGRSETFEPVRRKVYRDEDLLIQAIKPLVQPNDALRDGAYPHVVVALAEGDRPARRAAEVRRFVVDGIAFLDKPEGGIGPKAPKSGTEAEQMFCFLLRLWQNGATEFQDRPAPGDRWPVYYPRNTKSDINAFARNRGLDSDLVGSRGMGGGHRATYYLRSHWAQRKGDWRHVHFGVSTARLPGLPRMNPGPDDAER